MSAQPVNIFFFCIKLFKITSVLANQSGWLSKLQMETLENIEPSSKDDSKFVDFLLTALFDESVLKISSCGGKQSNFNKTSNAPLDKSKLEVLSSMNIQSFSRFSVETPISFCHFRFLCQTR